MRTSVTSHNALLRNGISVQLMNIKYITRVTKQNKESPIAYKVFHSNSFLKLGC